MADNILLSTGQTVGTDDIAGVHTPRVKLQIGADGTAVDVRSPVDALGSTGVLAAAPMLYSDATSLHYMQRGNTEGTLLASAARTAYTVSTVQTNHNARGVLVFLDVTVIGTGNLAPQFFFVSPLFGTFGPQFPGVTVTGMYTYLVYPGCTATGHTGSINSALSRQWLIAVQPSGATSWTYSVTHSLIV